MMLRSVVVVALVAMCGAGSATAQNGDDRHCISIGAKRGTTDYRECRLLLDQARSADPYISASARARLVFIQQHIFDEARRKEERDANPDFSQYGVPAMPRSSPAPSLNCITINGGNGVGVTDCD